MRICWRPWSGHTHDARTRGNEALTTAAVSDRTMKRSFFAGYAAATVLFFAAAPLFAADRWYLLVPPRTDYDERRPVLEGITILTEKGFAEWAQQGAYDTAPECKSARDRFLKRHRDIYSRSSEDFVRDPHSNRDPQFLKGLRSVIETQQANVAAFTAAQCIGHDDPRLRP
jgi:hypothetical protein